MKEIYVFVTHLQGISWLRTQQACAACDIKFNDRLKSALIGSRVNPVGSSGR